MRAVYINPADRSVTEVELDDHNPVSTVIQLLGGDTKVVVLGAPICNSENGDALYVNSNPPSDRRPDLRELWTYLGRPLWGPGVIVGRNFNDDAEVPLSRATDRTKWSDSLPEQVRQALQTH